MAYTPHARLVWGGVFTTGPTVWENWSCTLSCAVPGNLGTVKDPTTQQVDDAWAAIQAFHGRATSHQASIVRLSYMKLNAINELGKYALDTTHERALATPVGGMDTYQGLPYSTALRVTLDDGTRNRRNKGGFYLPMVGQDCAADGRFAGTVASDVAASVDTLLTALEATGLVPSIASKYGNLERIERIRVGTAPDTIRRRDNDRPEEYSELLRAAQV